MADLNGVIALSEIIRDRILVMHAGRIVGNLTLAEATEETLGLSMGGLTR